MKLVLISAALLGLALVSGVLTAALRQYALRRSLIDVPNSRSSHTRPTPRGGGLAIVACMLAVLPALAGLGLISAENCWGLLGAGLLVAAIGFVDDHGHIAARWRLLAHFVAAAWGLWWMGGAPPLVLGDQVFHTGWVGTVIATFYLVWLLNLYNFMDGIDGIASVEAITVCLAAALLHALDGATATPLLPLLLAAAAAGFLYWNFPPAQIFMGDAGSGFLGIVLGLMSLQAGWTRPELFWAWLILLGVFVVDATLTLVTRLLRAEKLHQAHRNHAYQHAARRCGGHLPVTLAVGALNLLWLLPIALWVATGRLDGLSGLVIAYAPLSVLALKLRAGMP